MKEKSSYDFIKSILDDAFEEDVSYDTKKSIDLDLLNVIFRISALVDKNASFCDKCLKIKNEILESSKELKNIINKQKNDVESQMAYNEIIKDFLKHFHIEHDNLKEVLDKNYSCEDYYGFKIIYEFKIKNSKNKLEKINKKYDLNYLNIAFEWIDKRIAKDEKNYRDLNKKGIQFIFNIFERKKLNTLTSNYLNFIKKVVAKIGKEREQFKKDKNEDYNLYYDLNLRIKGKDIIEEEKNRREKNKFFNIINFIKNYSEKDNKYLYKLTDMAMNIENLNVECEYCKQLKEKIVFSLEKLETLKKKKSKSKAYKKFVKTHYEIIKEYKNHFKNKHNKFDYDNFHKKIFVPLYTIEIIIMILLIIKFAHFIFEKSEIMGYVFIYVLAPLSFTYLKKINKKLIILIHDTKDIF